MFRLETACSFCQVSLSETREAKSTRPFPALKSSPFKIDLCKTVFVDEEKKLILVYPNRLKSGLRTWMESKAALGQKNLNI